MRDEDSNRYPIMVMIKMIRKDPTELISAPYPPSFRYTLSVAPPFQKHYYNKRILFLGDDTFAIICNRAS